MIEKMVQSINSGNFETDVYLQFTNFCQQRGCLKLTCSVYTEDEDKLVDQWLINCLDFEEYQLDSTNSYELEELEVTEDHPYLWEYQKAFTELYFKGETVNVKALIGALYLKHNTLTRGLIPFGRYLNINNESGYGGDLEWLLTRKQGMFSEAPALLNDAYEELLTDYGFSTSLLPVKVELPCNDCQLLRLGKSYIIAKEFNAVQINVENWIGTNDV